MLRRSSRQTIGRYQWLKAWAWQRPGLRLVVRQTGVLVAWAVADR